MFKLNKYNKNQLGGSPIISSDKTDPNETISVLTWNICFGCMYADKRSDLDKTAKNIALRCKNYNTEHNTNICLNNVVDFITEQNHDFICLQEATRWNEIVEKVKLKRNIGYVHHKLISEDMITIYNSDIYRLIYVKDGKLSIKGRPFQISFFKNKIGEIFVIINIHNKHYKYNEDDKDNVIIQAKKNLIDALTENNLYYINADFNIELINIEKEKKEDITTFINENKNKFNLVIMGDFNDNDINYWMGINLFDKMLKSNIKPPKTCCHFKIKLIGDYVLIDTDRLEFIIENKSEDKFRNVANETLTSDHIPVISTFKIKDEFKLKILDKLSSETSDEVPVVSSNETPVVTDNESSNITKILDNQQDLSKLLYILSEPLTPDTRIIKEKEFNYLMEQIYKQYPGYNVWIL